MGSKRTMLLNGLGTVLADETPKAKRFVDLFSGSASVAIHVASRFDVPVFAVDLQSYSAVLGNAVLQRSVSLDVDAVWKRWQMAGNKIIGKVNPPALEQETIRAVKLAREWSAVQKGDLTQAYGGHYFSPRQATTLDALLVSLPREPFARAVAHASLIQAASKCAASPGHTAQPFQPTETAKKFIFEAWNRDVMASVEVSLRAIAKQHSKMIGHAQTGDALTIAKNEVRKGDLCFIDPPYSGVHYSRFYHVLESVARGNCGEVSGAGRYPASELRPKSDFSKKSTAITATAQLLDEIARKGASAIVTFPLHNCSNGMSGEDVKKEAAKHFVVEQKIVRSRFSSMGGNSMPDHRMARVEASELILILRR